MYYFLFIINIHFRKSTHVDCRGNSYKVYMLKKKFNYSLFWLKKPVFIIPYNNPSSFLNYHLLNSSPKYIVLGLFAFTLKKKETDFKWDFFLFFLVQILNEFLNSIFFYIWPNTSIYICLWIFLDVGITDGEKRDVTERRWQLQQQAAAT